MSFETSLISFQTAEHFALCNKHKLYSIPVFLVFVMPTNYFFLVFNSSINFVLYCCVGREFRQGLARLFRRTGGQ